MAATADPKVSQQVMFVVQGGRGDGKLRPAVIVSVAPMTGLANLRVFLDGRNDHGALCYGDPADPNTAGWAPSAAYSEGKEPGTWHYGAVPTDPPHGG